MFKRFLLFGAVNIAMIVMISLILNLLGVEPYLTNAGLNYYSLAVFCLVWGMVGSFFSLMISKWMAKRMMGVQLVERHDPQFGWLVSKTHEMCKRSGIEKMPEVGVYHSDVINAFATGPSKNNSLVAVSTGLLERMDADQIEGVLAHEVSHIANGDMVTMTLIQGVMNAFVMFFARIAAFAISSAMRSDNDRRSVGDGFITMGLTFLFEIVFGVLAMFITSWFSRYREYRADNGGARLAGKEKMISALRALQANYESIKSEKQQVAAFQISSKSNLFKLLSTHPPLEERIAALQR